MVNVDRKWAPLALVVLAMAASVFAYGRLPAELELRMELLPFASAEPDGPVARELALSVLPIVALLVWMAFRAAPTSWGRRLGRTMFRDAAEAVTSPEHFERFGKTYDTIVFAVVFVLVGAHAAILVALAGYPVAAVRVIVVATGLALVLMGNVMPRLRPNWVAGLRTKRVLDDPRLWRTVHRAFGAAFVVSGIVTIAVGLLRPEFGLMTAIGGVLVSLLIGAIATRRAGAQPLPTT